MSGWGRGSEHINLRSLFQNFPLTMPFCPLIFSTVLAPTWPALHVLAIVWPSWWSVMIKSLSSVSVWSWASDSTSLCFSFLFTKMGVIVAPTSQDDYEGQMSQFKQCLAQCCYLTLSAIDDFQGRYSAPALVPPHKEPFNDILIGYKKALFG